MDRAGIAGEDGPTHHGSLDIAYLRCIQDMVVSAPRNGNEFRHLLYSALNQTELPFSIRYPKSSAIDFDIDDQNFSIFCEVSDFHKIINKFVDKFKEPDSTQLVWRSENSVFLELDSAQKNIKLINDLEENDDVQNVFSNFEVDESVIKKLIT